MDIPVTTTDVKLPAMEEDRGFLDSGLTLKNYHSKRDELGIQRSVKEVAGVKTVRCVNVNED